MSDRKTAQSRVWQMETERLLEEAGDAEFAQVWVDGEYRRLARTKDGWWITATGEGWPRSPKWRIVGGPDVD